MRLELKEDPLQWRKSAWLGALGLAGAATLLRWRGVLPAQGWRAGLALLAIMAWVAWMWPRCFRGYYRFSSRLGFAIVQWGGRTVLALFFLVVVTPLGLVLRACGKDLLGLKRPPPSGSCWVESKESSPLERLF